MFKAVTKTTPLILITLPYFVAKCCIISLTFFFLKHTWDYRAFVEKSAPLYIVRTLFQLSSLSYRKAVDTLWSNDPLTRMGWETKRPESIRSCVFRTSAAAVGDEATTTSRVPNLMDMRSRPCDCVNFARVARGSFLPTWKRFPTNGNGNGPGGSGNFVFDEYRYFNMITKTRETRIEVTM